MGEKIMNVIAVMSVALMVWIGASWFDVIADNSTTAQHADWNAFVIMTEMVEEN